MQTPLGWMKRVFLVEDNRDNAELVEDLLCEAYEVTWFEDGPKLLSSLEQSATDPPGIFLLDIGLPGMDGVELLGKIKEIDGYQNIPSIALTAHAMIGDEPKFREAGFNGYVSKPITDEETLVNEIERLLV